MNQYYHKTLVRHGFNPRLEIYMRSNKLLAEVLEHLNNKWSPTYLENSGQEFNIGLMALWDGKIIEFTVNQEKFTVGDIFLSLENPVPWQLYYYWKPLGGPLRESREQTYQSVVNLLPENSNSIPFLQNPEEARSYEPQSPFKTLFKPTSNPFSLGEEEPKPFSAPKELLAEKSLSEFRQEGEESMFSAFFGFNRH